MNRPLLILLVAVVLSPAGSAALAQIPTAPPQGDFILTTPSCATFDTDGNPATAFGSEAELILRGASFPPQSLVLVGFRQGALTVELGRFRTADDGGFSTEPTFLRLPSGSVAGPAAITVSSGGPSASCEIQMSAPVVLAASTPQPKPAPWDPNPWFAVWAALLATGGGALTFVTYRRWQEQRLARAIGRRAQRRRSGPPRLEDVNRPGPAMLPEPGPPVLPVGWDAGREPTPIRGFRPSGE